MAIKIKTFKQNGSSVGEIELNSDIFGRQFNESLVHQVVVAQMANARQGSKSTLTRTEVRGGGKKPWRQKGTGRARQGSIRSPQWNGGGVVFAPKPRDFDKKVNKKAKDLALFSALSVLVLEKRLIVLDSIKLKENKTKEIASVFKALKLDKSVLIVLNKNENDIVRACNNIEKLDTVQTDLINVYDLLAHENCVITVDSIKAIEEQYKNFFEEEKKVLAK